MQKRELRTYCFPLFIGASEDRFDIEKEYMNKFIEQDTNKKVNNNLFEEMCILYVAITRCSGEIELSDLVKKYILLRYKTNGHDLHVS